MAWPLNLRTRTSHKASQTLIYVCVHVHTYTHIHTDIYVYMQGRHEVQRVHRCTTGVNHRYLSMDTHAERLKSNTRLHKTCRNAKPEVRAVKSVDREVAH